MERQGRMLEGSGKEGKESLCTQCPQGLEILKVLWDMGREAQR